MRFHSWPSCEPLLAQGITLENIEQKLGYLVPIRVLWSRDEALSEARRLNELNGPKGSLYYVTHTRVEA